MRGWPACRQSQNFTKIISQEKTGRYPFERLIRVRKRAEVGRAVGGAGAVTPGRVRRSRHGPNQNRALQILQR